MWGLTSLQERISRLFHAHGLFCASHPFAIIFLVIVAQIIICWPLLNFPLPGNAPLQHRTVVGGYSAPSARPLGAADTEAGRRPRWYLGGPVAYIQQVVVRVTVSPWQSKRLIQSDAFRGALATVYDVIEHINNFHYNDGKRLLSVSDVCLRVLETVREKRTAGLLPQYNCLMLSPANFWSNDKQAFMSDPEILKTVFKNYGPVLSAQPAAVKELLFGLPAKDTGLKKLYFRNRQRVVAFAVTIVLRDYNPGFLSALRQKLAASFPQSNVSLTTDNDDMVHIHFKDQNYIVEYTPLLVTYAVLFLYIYFSVRKIEMVKSKWGLALSAVCTVVASLMMSVSICLLFGLTPSLNGSEIFPYLVVIIGLENVLVVTKSVVSTPVHLDVKLRVAKGLSKEGWYIFKHVVSELLILAVGFLTFVPAIQEFCVFALVGLMSDLYLQMFFFTSVLSIDIRRMELSDLHHQSVQQSLHDHQEVTGTVTSGPPAQCPVMRHLGQRRDGPSTHLYVNTRAPHSTSTPPPSPTGGSEVNYPSHYDAEKIPRRVQLLNFWASTRVVQRLIMACLVWWIGCIVYKAGILEHILHHVNATLHQAGGEAEASTVLPSMLGGGGGGREHSWVQHEQDSDPGAGGASSSALSLAQQRALVAHSDLEPWARLSYSHWPTLFSYYNLSLSGRYVSLLPVVPLSILVPPDVAIQQRHPLEEARTKAQDGEFSHLNAAADTDFDVDAATNAASYNSGGAAGGAGDPAVAMDATFKPNQSLNLLLVMRRLTHYPRNRTELAVTVMLGVASLILWAYFMVALYKCVCPRNYAKWRTSWGHSRGRRSRGGRGAASPYYKQIREAMPLVLEGHVQEVECVVTDGPLVVSSCLGGQLRVWDSTSGECLSTINRRRMTPPVTRKPVPGRNVDDSDADLYAEYHGKRQISLGMSPPSASGSYLPMTTGSPPPPSQSPGATTTPYTSPGGMLIPQPQGAHITHPLGASPVSQQHTSPHAMHHSGSCRDSLFVAGGGDSGKSGYSPSYVEGGDSPFGNSPHMGGGCDSAVLAGSVLGSGSCSSDSAGGIVVGGVSASPPRVSSRYELSPTYLFPPPAATRARRRNVSGRAKSFGSVFDFMPDLSDTIDTDFAELAKRSKKDEEERKRQSVSQQQQTQQPTGLVQMQQQQTPVVQPATTRGHARSGSNVSVGETSPLSGHRRSGSTGGQTATPPPPTTPYVGGHKRSGSNAGGDSAFRPTHSRTGSNASLGPPLYQPPVPTEQYAVQLTSPVSTAMVTHPQYSAVSTPQTLCNTLPTAVPQSIHGNTSPTSSPSPPTAQQHQQYSTPLSIPQPKQQQQHPPPSTLSPPSSATTGGYDFSSRFSPLYAEHEALIAEKRHLIERRITALETEAARRRRQTEQDLRPAGDEWEEDAAGTSEDGGGAASAPTEPFWCDEDDRAGHRKMAPPAVWCLACQDNLIVAGCGNGAIEFWDGLTGQLKYMYCNNQQGATAVCFIASRVIVARLNGSVDFLELETFVNINRTTASASTTLHHRQGHLRSASAGSALLSDMKSWDDTIRCSLVTSFKAHQRPINLLRSEGGRVVTASQDHTLKVFRLEDSLCLYTLHGHSDNVTALFLDKGAPLAAAASGSEDGTVRLWDLLTGNCVHKLQGHDSMVTNITCTPQFVVSSGADDRLCVWDRLKGTLLHWIQMEAGFCNSLAMLTSHLMVTGGQGTLYLWDVSKGEVLRAVTLGDNDYSVFVRSVLVIANSIVVCDYGNQLRVVHFPAVLEKAD